MQFSLSRNNRLLEFAVHVEDEGGIFFVDASQARIDLLFVSLGLGLHGNADHGVGERNARKQKGLRAVAQGISRVGVLELD